MIPSIGTFDRLKWPSHLKVGAIECNSNAGRGSKPGSLGHRSKLFSVKGCTAFAECDQLIRIHGLVNLNCAQRPSNLNVYFVCSSKAEVQAWVV